MGIEMNEDTLKASTASLKAATERLTGIGTRLQKDFRGDKAFARHDPVEDFASSTETFSNTVEALAKTAEVTAVEIEGLRKENADLSEQATAAIGHLKSQRERLVKGGRVHADCKGTGKTDGKRCEKCEGVGILQPRTA